VWELGIGIFAVAMTGDAVASNLLGTKCPRAAAAQLTDMMVCRRDAARPEREYWFSLRVAEPGKTRDQATGRATPTPKDARNTTSHR